MAKRLLCKLGIHSWIQRNESGPWRTELDGMVSNVPFTEHYWVWRECRCCGQLANGTEQQRRSVQVSVLKAIWTESPVGGIRDE